MTVAMILERMTDTADPVNGSVFEKQIDTDIVSFDSFMRNAYKIDHVSLDTENGHLLAMYYGDRNGEYHHIGTFNFDISVGCFAGVRVGSKNPFREQGQPLVKFHFSYKP
jgi:hypothetical protein